MEPLFLELQIPATLLSKVWTNLSEDKQKYVTYALSVSWARILVRSFFTPTSSTKFSIHLYPTRAKSRYKVTDSESVALEVWTSGDCIDQLTKIDKWKQVINFKCQNLPLPPEVIWQWTLLDYLLLVMSSIIQVLKYLFTEYSVSTPKRIKLIDAYLLYILLTGVIQFAYCCLVGTFPFNSFLAGFCSTVASFTLATSLRLQINPKNKLVFSSIDPRKAFGDFLFGHLVVHFVVVNFLGWNGGPKCATKCVPQKEEIKDTPFETHLKVFIYFIILLSKHYVHGSTLKLLTWNLVQSQ